MDINLRILEENDNNFLEEMLFEAIFLPASQKRGLSRDIIYQPELYMYINRWGRKGDMAIVAETGKTKRKVGCAWGRLFSADAKGYGYVADDIPELSIAVRSRYRNKGIGSMLLGRLISEYKLAGYRKISLSVSKQNPCANLYLREGFINYRENGRDLVMIYNPERIH
jgi:ribosomal protein S18 acetylase RimI-like enzyme